MRGHGVRDQADDLLVRGRRAEVEIDVHEPRAQKVNVRVVEGRENGEGPEVEALRTGLEFIGNGTIADRGDAPVFYQHPVARAPANVHRPHARRQKGAP